MRKNLVLVHKLVENSFKIAFESQKEIMALKGLFNEKCYIKDNMYLLYINIASSYYFVNYFYNIEHGKNFLAC